jgi:hypothetical protein
MALRKEIPPINAGLIPTAHPQHQSNSSNDCPMPALTGAVKRMLKASINSIDKSIYLHFLIIFTSVVSIPYPSTLRKRIGVTAMKTKLIIALTLSVLAANTFAADGYDRTIAADGYDRTGSATLAADGFDRTGSATLAADGFDRTGSATLAADGFDRTGSASFS